MTITATDVGLTGGAFLARGGNSGRKIHVGLPGSSVLACGHWLKADATYYRVRSAASTAVLCDNCPWPTVKRCASCGTAHVAGPTADGIPDGCDVCADCANAGRPCRCGL